MINLRILKVIGVIFLLTGCSGNSVLPTFTPVPSNVTSAFTPTPYFTTALTPPASTLVPATSSTIPTEAHLKFECLEVNKSLPSNSRAKDTIIFVQSDDPKQAYLWNMETGDKKMIPVKENEILRDFAISPDNKLLAYTRSTINGTTTVSKNLEIISLVGELHEVIPVEINMVSLSGWLDNQRLIFRESFEPISTQIVLNPFTGQRQELLPDFPNIYDNNPGLDWKNQGIIVFDPTITRVVYAGLPADLILMDLTNKLVIARISPVPIADSIPEWSPDGEQFVITNADITNPENLHYELYSIGRNGQVNQLTNLAAYYKKTFILSYNWSPDGRYIAFWLEDRYEQTGIVSLAVLDTVNLDVTNYCLKSTYEGYSVPPPLFWSPDGKYLVIEVVNQNDKDISRLILVDIVEGAATQIAENLTPVGWIKAK
jgi:WD40 repeat protein